MLAAVPASAGPFDECAQRLRTDPGSRAAAECFKEVAETGGHWDEAARLLLDAHAGDRASGWVAFYLAEVRSRQREADAPTYFRAAVDTFAASSDAGAEAEARLGLGAALFLTGRREDAWAEGPPLLAAARRSGNAVLTARALMYEPWIAVQTGERLGPSVRLMREAHALVFPGGPYALRQRALGLLGNLASQLGRVEEALAYYAAWLDLARQNADTAAVVLASYNVINARRKQMEELPDPERLPEFIDFARELTTLADATGRPGFQAMAHRTLGDLLWATPDTRMLAIEHYETALDHSRKDNDRSETAISLWVLGRALADVRPGESRRLIDEALGLAVDSGRATAVAYAWRQQMRLAWKTLTRPQATAESLRALDAIETLRALQEYDDARAAVLSAWTLDYYWLIGQLLNQSTVPRDDIALAFEVAERMRARQLLDSLLRPSHKERERSTSTRRNEILRAISQVQRQLLDPRVEAAAKTAAIADLERLEREEEAARAELPAVAAPGFASLDRVEQALRPDEAVLSFTVGVGRNFYGEFGGGAWLLATTHTGTRVFRIPDRAAQHPMMAIFRGLAEREDEADIGPSVRLYEILLQTALKSLPANVRRLIVIPDGPLHHLPLTALRPTRASAPLGATHEVSVAPSATVWMQLRQHAPLTDSRGAFVLADPGPLDAPQNGRVSEERGWSIGGWPPGRLPYSRVEGRAVTSALGRGSRLLAGADATEAAVKAEVLESFAIVHFATHAFVDDVHPDRSAVVLAGDPALEDGLLQAREIADLNLSGRIVVLSACRSATGAVLAGEGVMGLSRSFFEAGARTVIGTLWPIRDDHAATFFGSLYASLGRGHPVGIAVRNARREASAQGLPASVWSSVVVIGDDTVEAVPGAAPAPARTYLLLTLLSTLFVLTALKVARSRRARQPARPE